MEIIRVLSEKIDDELEDAQKYIKCAYKRMDDAPMLADLYYRLSLDEMNHANMLHEAVVKIINDYKKDHEVPPAMQTLYDYLHKRHIAWANKIKAKQDNFKK